MAGKKISDLVKLTSNQVALTDVILLARQDGSNVIVSYEDFKNSFAKNILEGSDTIKEFQNFQLFITDH